MAYWQSFGFGAFLCVSILGFHLLGLGSGASSARADCSAFYSSHFYCVKNDYLTTAEVMCPYSLTLGSIGFHDTKVLKIIKSALLGEYFLEYFWNIFPWVMKVVLLK